GDRRNISAQLRRGNISSGTRENIGKATASARILESPLWWLRSAAVRLGLSGQYGGDTGTDGTFPRKCGAKMSRQSPHCSVGCLRNAATRIGRSAPLDQRPIQFLHTFQTEHFRAMRRENVSSVPALQRGLPPKRRHQALTFRATRPAAKQIFSHLPDVA